MHCIGYLGELNSKASMLSFFGEESFFGHHLMRVLEEEVIFPPYFANIGVFAEFYATTSYKISLGEFTCTFNNENGQHRNLHETF